MKRMKHRTEEELERMAQQAAERDFARLIVSGLPVTPKLVGAMARRAAEAQVQADLEAEDGQDKKERRMYGIVSE